MYLGDQKHTSSSAILDAIHAAVTEKNNPVQRDQHQLQLLRRLEGLLQNSERIFRAGGLARPVGIHRDRRRRRGRTQAKLQRGCVTGTSRNINEIGASPNVTAIGGTEFSPNYSGGNDVGSVSESVWNDGDGAAGGGQSKVFKKPAFQKGLIKKDKKRDVPDISFGASPATPGFFFGGREVTARRRSYAASEAPASALRHGPAISQLISQSNGAPIGNLNTRIYQLGAIADGATTGIRDVTSGNTSFNGVTGFSATTGYDKASGWGTVDMGLFVPAYPGPLVQLLLLSTLSSPRSNSSKAVRRDSGDEARDVEHRGRRKDCLGSEIDFRQTL